MKLWLDCDTGCDDTFAIVLAGHNESINLIGISTIFGNNTVEMTTKNTLQILEASGLQHVKVKQGGGKQEGHRRLSAEELIAYWD